MTELNGVQRLFTDVVAIDLLAYRLEKAKEVVSSHEQIQENEQAYYQALIPQLKQEVEEAYIRILGKLDGIADAESGLARIALRRILKGCGLGDFGL